MSWESGIYGNLGQEFSLLRFTGELRLGVSQLRTAGLGLNQGLAEPGVRMCSLEVPLQMPLPGSQPPSSLRDAFPGWLSTAGAAEPGNSCF